MKYFENQQVDEIGIVSVKLQKILIFLLIVNCFGIINALLHGCMIGLILLSVALLMTSLGLKGASKRRYKLVRTYYIFTVIEFTFFLIALTWVLVNILGREPSESTPSTDQPSNTADDQPDSEEDHSSGRMWVVVLRLVVLSIIVAYRIVSMILSARLSVMLKRKLEENLSLPTRKPSPPTADAQQQTTQVPPPNTQYPAVMYMPLPMQPHSNAEQMVQPVPYYYNYNQVGQPQPMPYFNPYIQPPPQPTFAARPENQM